MTKSRSSGIRKNVADFFTQPVVSLLVKTRVTPDVLTWCGFLLSLGGAVLIITRHFVAAGLVVLIAGFFDILDGALARRSNRITAFGGILDSTFDRISEAVVLLGILTVYAREGSFGEILVVGIALAGSELVSYIRARAEVAGLNCEVGIFTRSERVVVIALGLLLNQIDYALFVAVAIIAVFSVLTVVHRLIYAWRQTVIKG